MCGIFSLVTTKDKEIGGKLVECGRKLAYRGYDSVGCATISKKGIDLRKSVGKIEEVSKKLNFSKMIGSRGIIQLRWATFGAPSKTNAQPFFDCDKDMVGAENGNVVNNIQLREKFIKEGHKVRSTNDGESCVHAVERYYDKGYSMVESIRKAYKDLLGDYAFIITNKKENKLYAIKKGSGLVVGIGDQETCCSSDLPSILPITDKIIWIKDGEIVILSPDRIEIRKVSDRSIVKRRPEIYEGGMEAAEKGGYPYFMLKEINEQPKVACDLIHLLGSSPHIKRFLDALRLNDQIFFVGCGSSYHACLLGAYYFNKIAKKSVIPVLGPQFIEQYGNSIHKKTVVVFVSQSGETKDVLNAVNFVNKKGGRVLGILNVLGSTLMHKSEVYLPLACGYEISVPATKTFLNQVVLFLYLAKRTKGEDGNDLENIPKLLEKTLKKTSSQAERIANLLKDKDDMYYLGYGITHGSALEGALKLKEITYSHCEGIFSSEFKHGPLSVVQRGYPVIFVVAPEDVHMMINHINEVICRDGKAIVIGEENKLLRKSADEFITIPKSNQYLNPILATIPMQLIAYYTSLKREINPDFPRNLSKTLTVD